MNDNLYNNNSEFTKISDNKPHEIIKNKKDEENNLLLNKSNKTEKIEETKIETYTKRFNYLCKKKGNTYIILVDKNNTPIITIGPDKIFFIIFILFISGGFSFLFIGYYQYIPLYLFISGIITYLLFIVVYTILFLSNPGYPERVDLNLVRKSKRNFMYCSECNIWVGKNSGIKHCHRCGMCIEKYDHHCDWISKCVGKGNINYFYFFIIWIVMVIIYFIAAFVIVHEKWFEYQRYLRNIEKMKNNQNP
jgi:hypothetical protein